MGILGARDVCFARLKAAVGEGVAREAGLAVEGRNAGDAAVAGRLAARQPINQTIVIDGTLDALPLRAMRTCRALAERAASRRASDATRVASAPGGRGASLASSTTLACVVERSGGRRPAEPSAACPARSACSSAARLHIELEAPVAGRMHENEPSRGEREVKPTLAAHPATPSHGPATSFLASSSANPRG